MIKITCPNCKEENFVNMYLYDSRIILNEAFDQREYFACVKSKAICPSCGLEIENRYSCPIYSSDITRLALRKEDTY